MTKQRFIKLLLSFVIGLALASLISVYQIKSERSKQNVVAKNFGGEFTLTDHTGKQVTDKDFAGQYRLIYFGFTYCPAICPTELQRMSSILNALGDEGEGIQSIFITVDPERDNAEIMKNYVVQFHPRLIGLTGTPEQIETAKKAYKIYAAKVQDETMSDYTMDHSSFIYFIDPDDNLLRIFKINDSVETMTNVIREQLK